MKLLSLNLWNLNPVLTERMDVLDKHVASNEYDILVFQEVSLVGESSAPQTGLLTSAAEYNCVYQETGKWAGRVEGLAVMTRQRPIAVAARRLPGRATDMDRGLLHVTVTLGDSCLHIFNTHLAFRSSDEELRLQQATIVRGVVLDVLLKQPREHVVVCGDFNDIPGSATLKMFEGMDGLRSPFLGELAIAHTFSSRNPLVDAALVPDRRIDHIFVSNHTATSDEALVLWQAPDVATDHYGLTIALTP